MRKILGFQLEIYFITFLITKTGGFSTGAPKTKEVCSNLLPHHKGAEFHPVSGGLDDKFFLTTSYTIDGSNVHITASILSRSMGHKFKGFIVQLRPEMSPYDVLPSFPIGRVEAKQKSRPLQCNGHQNTATHTDPELKGSVSINFTLPFAFFRREYHVQATVVENYQTIWTDLRSDILLADKSKTMFAADPAFDWLTLASSVAEEVARGSEDWRSNIKARLGRGFGCLTDEHGLFVTKYIKTFLPFQENYAQRSDDHITEIANTQIFVNDIEDYASDEDRTNSLQNNHGITQQATSKNDIVRETLAGRQNYWKQIKHFIGLEYGLYIM